MNNAIDIRFKRNRLNWDYIYGLTLFKLCRN